MIMSLSASASVLISLAAGAAPVAWSVSPDGSRVEFAVEGRFYPVTGRFPDLTGEARLDEADPAGSSLTLTVGTGSVATGVDVRDALIRGGRVFDAARHPRAVFRLTGFTSAGDGLWNATGTLEWRGVRQTIRIAVQRESQDSEDGHMRLSGETTISRHAFGIDWTPRINPIGDEVRIIFSLLLTRPAGSLPIREATPSTSGRNRPAG